MIKPGCAEAGIPQNTEFATKPVLARAMLARTLDAGIPVSWVTADEAYGQDYKFRHFLELRRLNYVVAVPKSQRVGADEGSALLGLDSPAGRRLDETRRFFAFIREEINRSMAKWRRLQEAEREAGYTTSRIWPR
ncbi:hypothetical protein GCM10023194_25510 [Planotetraspora phitsanulokensis]|uniref:Transposase IS701-like DDE domain-containing protein n=1 Tax=Planotetraspora phitsanulokensis TaxID=575192 RepID=A0A8J3XMM9_9ACTN|nr:hypothetical protein Pph01_69010 [Planotetraspora phitsanulokensis]